MEMINISPITELTRFCNEKAATTTTKNGKADQMNSV